MFVIEDRPNQILKGIAQALTVSKIPSVLWNPRFKSTFDMFAEKQPKLLIVGHQIYKEIGLEILAAKNKYGGDLLVLGFDGINTKAGVFFNPYPTFSNLVLNNGVPSSESYRTDVSIICNDYTTQDKETLQLVIDKLKTQSVYNFTNNREDISFRIYGERLIDTPHYVGQITEYSYGFIYKNSTILIDLHGDHMGNPELHGNKSILVKDFLDDNITGINSRESYIEQNNFSATSSILNSYAFLKEADIVKENGDKFVELFIK